MLSVTLCSKCLHNPVKWLKTAVLLIPFSLLLSVNVYGQSEVSLSPEPDILFPRAFGIAVNQVGYMEGGSLVKMAGHGEPVSGATWTCAITGRWPKLAVKLASGS
jgi:hypothetical protein